MSRLMILGLAAALIWANAGMVFAQSAYWDLNETRDAEITPDDFKRILPETQVPSSSKPFQMYAQPEPEEEPQIATPDEQPPQPTVARPRTPRSPTDTPPPRATPPRRTPGPARSQPAAPRGDDAPPAPAVDQPPAPRPDTPGRPVSEQPDEGSGAGQPVPAVADGEDAPKVKKMQWGRGDVKSSDEKPKPRWGK